MKVSVIVRTYNRAYILKRAIESALNQTYRDSEIIVVDDGSTDDTEYIVTQMNCSSVRYIRHPANRGVGAACNTGILAAKGDLVAFLDSDDRWAPDKLDLHVRFVQKYPQVDAVFSDVTVSGNRRYLPSLIGIMRRFPSLLRDRASRTDHLLSSRQMYLCLLEEIPIKPSALVVKRRVFDMAGMFNECWKSGEDWEFLLRLSRSARFGYIDLPLAFQVWSQDSTLKRYWCDDKLSLIDLFTREKRTLRSDPEALAAARRGICRQCATLGQYYLIRGRRKQSILVFLRGFRETAKLELLGRAANALLGFPRPKSKGLFHSKSAERRGSWPHG